METNKKEFVFFDGQSVQDWFIKLRGCSKRVKGENVFRGFAREEKKHTSISMASRVDMRLMADGEC